MVKWFSQNWYIVTGILGGCGLMGLRIWRRPAEESFFRKVQYSLIPAMDPEREESKKLTPRALALFGIGLLIILILNLLGYMK